ncbi:MAG: 2'-5' RNA ligase family protein [Cyanobacteria bacterium SZAS-4]|nr:2'-5' RNA ligase family protein [Cyanobacteria bacterium SZAS-4]
MSCVLTLAMDPEAQQRFEDARQKWFPKERNFIPAHLTLFHVLPESEETMHVLSVVSNAVAQFPMRIAEIRSLGRGVAYFLESKQLTELHRYLSANFQDFLTAQDKQKFHPHVVVQNKVAPEVAKATLEVLRSDFAPSFCTAVGLDLWRYVDGHWLPLKRFVFG